MREGVSYQKDLGDWKCSPAKSFVWPRPGEQIGVDAVEIGKV